MEKIIAIIVLTVGLWFPISSLAMPCHCFTDREYDPGQPALADPYFLATTENSFFAVINGLKKKDVIFAKQTPSTTAENLWIAYWLAEKTGEQSKTLIKARFRNSSWTTTLAALKTALDGLPTEVRSLLESEPNDSTLATLVVDRILEDRKVIRGAELDQLREAGTDNQETILAALLALKTGQAAIGYLNEVKTGQRSWGTHLLKAGLNGNDMEVEIDTLLPSQIAK